MTPRPTESQIDLDEIDRLHARALLALKDWPAALVGHPPEVDDFRTEWALAYRHGIVSELRALRAENAELRRELDEARAALIKIKHATQGAFDSTAEEIVKETLDAVREVMDMHLDLGEGDWKPAAGGAS